MFLQATQQDLCWLTTEFIRTACIRVKGIYDNVDLKQIDSQLFLQQNRFIQEQKRIVILDILMANHTHVQKAKERNAILWTWKELL